MLFAKGIASGFPFAGIAAKPEMYQGLPTGSLVGLASLSCSLGTVATPHSKAWQACHTVMQQAALLIGRASLLICFQRGHRPLVCSMLVPAIPSPYPLNESCCVTHLGTSYAVSRLPVADVCCLQSQASNLVKEAGLCQSHLHMCIVKYMLKMLPES